MRFARRLILLAPLLFLALSSHAAQTAVVDHKANLRKDPSAQNAPIVLLFPEAKLTVLDTTTSTDYVKVRTEDGKTGWVFKRFIEIFPEATPPTPPAPPPAPAGPTAPAPSGKPSDTILSTWDKQKPVSVPFVGTEGTCGPTGDNGKNIDTATNALKNRSDPMPAVHDVTWAAIGTLAFPAAKPNRLNWTKQQLAQIQPFEGVAVRTVGFLSRAAKVEDSGNGESTNCHFTDKEDVDWHVYLEQQPADGIGKAVIVETTPRIRQHVHWDVTVLNKLAGAGRPVRISGYLMLDPEHRDMVGSARGTVWEIHPVMKIELCSTTSCDPVSDTGWVDLDGAQ